jgi:hypothetical protein
MPGRTRWTAACRSTEPRRCARARGHRECGARGPRVPGIGRCAGVLSHRHGSPLHEGMPDEGMPARPSGRAACGARRSRPGPGIAHAHSRGDDDTGATRAGHGRRGTARHATPDRFRRQVRRDRSAPGPGLGTRTGLSAHTGPCERPRSIRRRCQSLSHRPARDAPPATTPRQVPSQCPSAVLRRALASGGQGPPPDSTDEAALVLASGGPGPTARLSR